MSQINPIAQCHIITEEYFKSSFAFHYLIARSTEELFYACLTAETSCCNSYVYSNSCQLRPPIKLGQLGSTPEGKILLLWGQIPSFQRAVKFLERVEELIYRSCLPYKNGRITSISIALTEDCLLQLEFTHSFGPN